MSIKVTRVKLWDSPTLKAFVDVSFFDKITVKNCKVIEGSKGLFVSMPQELGGEDKWYDLVKTNNKEAANEIKEIVLAAYQAEASKPVHV